MVHRKRSEKTGLPPGSLIHVGEMKEHAPRITVLDYDKTTLEEKEVQNVEECFPFKDKPTVTWINIDGIHDPEVIDRLGKHFGFHSLLLEDIMNTEQRPKMDDFGDHIFIVLKMLKYHGAKIKTEQISIIVGKNFVISFLENAGKTFENIRERIRKSKGKVRTRGSDYLAYVLVDTIVDDYFLALEKISGKIEDIENEMV